MSKYVTRPQLIWLPAKGPKLSDHPWGSLCKDDQGHTFLIGDVEEGTNQDSGCGCWADELTYSPIVEYAIVCEEVDE